MDTNVLEQNTSILQIINNRLNASIVPPEEYIKRLIYNGKIEMAIDKLRNKAIQNQDKFARNCLIGYLRVWKRLASASLRQEEREIQLAHLSDSLLKLTKVLFN